MSFQSPVSIIPPRLSRGDRVMVVSSSGALKEFKDFEKSIEIWRSRGYQVDLAPHYQDRVSYLAGGDAARREALRTAWQNPDCKAILCTRGGYGSMRLLEDWQWPTVNITPKWVIGFSDITGLLWSLAKIGIRGLHGPVLTTLNQEPLSSQNRLFDFLEKGKLEPLQGKGWGGGSVRGTLMPANLTVATHLLGTVLQPNLENAILALEDVTEAPYRIDRMLTQWRLSGVFSQIKGIALGRFSRCEAPVGVPSWTVEEVLRDRLGDLGLPIVSDLAFGHDGENSVLPVGAEVQLDGDRGLLSFD
ncbi:MAG: S66 peptidase family protein [Microcystaceae cyanobacterium]